MTGDSIGSAATVATALHGLRQTQQHEGATASVLAQTQGTPSAPEQQAAQPQQAGRKSADAGDTGRQDQPGRGQNLDLEA
jgi:hypothetical protein